MKPWARALSVLVLGLGLSVSCSSPASDSAGLNGSRAGSASGPRELISAAGTWRVTLSTEPSPIPLNEPFSVFVSVARNGTTNALPGIPVRVDAAMPHHQHGMNRVPEHSRVSPEVVRASGLLFHMPGAWTLSFDVTDGAITERAELVVEVR